MLNPKINKLIFEIKHECDDFQETIYETDCDAFVSFVVANTAKSLAQALKRLLPDFYGCPALHGKSFLVSIDQNGEVGTDLETLLLTAVEVDSILQQRLKALTA